MIVVVDYGMGNLRSVSKALEHLGASVKVSGKAEEVKQADKLVLPGVGAFGDAMKELVSAGLREPVLEFISSKRPFLGICLGLQLLFESSEESPGVKGLGVLKGKVREFDSAEAKVPHMGWNQIEKTQAHPLLEGVESGDYFYFVHSFYADCAESTAVAAECRYGGNDFTAMVGTESLFATQFHPEKSQQAGLRILTNFLKWRTDESLSGD